MQAKIWSCVFRVPCKRSKHSSYMLTLPLPRITSYGRHKSICYQAVKILNLFSDSTRTIESINDFMRARKKKPTFKYFCNNSLDFRILNINYDSFIYLLFSKIRTQQSYYILIIRVEIKCMYVGRNVGILHRLSRTLRRVKH